MEYSSLILQGISDLYAVVLRFDYHQKRRMYAFIDNIEQALLYQDRNAYYTVMFEAVGQSLDEYLKAITESALNMNY
jgi:hypothetical protein